MWCICDHIFRTLLVPQHQMDEPDIEEMGSLMVSNCTGNLDDLLKFFCQKSKFVVAFPWKDHLRPSLAVSPILSINPGCLIRKGTFLSCTQRFTAQHFALTNPFLWIGQDQKMNYDTFSRQTKTGNFFGVRKKTWICG